MSNGDLGTNAPQSLGYIAVRHFDHKGLCQLPNSFVQLCNCSVCILCIAKQFVTDKNPQGRNITKGSRVGHLCHGNQMSVLDLNIGYHHAVMYL